MCLTSASLLLPLQAIEFAMEEDDADLWEVLINLSIDKPSEENLADPFIAVLFILLPWL